MLYFYTLKHLPSVQKYMNSKTVSSFQITVGSILATVEKPNFVEHELCLKCIQ
jgi:hypothetical protein